MLTGIFSLALLILFSELASANMKRLAPVLEAWDQSRNQNPESTSEKDPIAWIGGWEKLAAAIWALGLCLPALAFSISSFLFLEDSNLAGNLMMGTALGGNVVGLSLGFGLLLVSGPLSFFRVRTITSPVFLLIATVVLIYICLNLEIRWMEGVLLLSLLVAYGFYFRRFSSEWKYYERAYVRQSLVESTEGIFPVLAVFCMGIGFFFIAVIAAYPLVATLNEWLSLGKFSAFQFGTHLIALALYLPMLVKSLFAPREGTTWKAMAISSISHACVLNVLLLPALGSFFGVFTLDTKILSFHLPMLFAVTSVFVSALLIEKEKGGKLPIVLLLSFVAYTVLSFTL
jgi:Ca2+/Na+ antiporter